MIEGGDRKRKEVQLSSDSPLDDNEYHAIDVACGPSCVFVVGRQQQSVHVAYEDKESEAIAKKIREVLLEEGDLIKFFGLNTIKDETKEDGDKMRSYYLKLTGLARHRRSTKKSKMSMPSVASESLENEQLYKSMKGKSSYHLPVKKDTFCGHLESRWNICNG